jgi:ABC-type lipoprotein release transport system permease subunit
VVGDPEGEREVVAGLGIDPRDGRAVAAVGLDSVPSCLVQQRTREIGVRVALGARLANIAGLILAESVWMALPGVALGMGVAFVGGRFLEPLLF